MLEKFQFFSLLIANYLVLGVLLAILTRGLLYLLSANATTRHNVWIGVLVLLLFLPAQSLVSPTAQTSILDLSLITNSSQSHEQTVVSPIRIIENPEQSEFTVADELGSTSPLKIDAQVNHWQDDFWQIFRDYILQSPLLSWAGVLIALLLLAGTLFRFAGVIDAHRKLNNLITVSKLVDGQAKTQLVTLSGYLGLERVPTLKHNHLVTTPQAAGVLRPVVLLPSSLLHADVSNTLLEQVLLHELAHVKRRDTLIVVIQAVVSIFLYWHPAFRYINRKIKFERELACDDWVISYERDGRHNPATSYANTLVELTELLHKQPQTVNSLACPQSTHGLRSRVHTLLNSSLDHSTNLSRKPFFLVLPLISLLTIAWTPIWPRYSFSAPIIAENNSIRSLNPQIEPISIIVDAPEQPDLAQPDNSEDQPAVINTISEELPIKQSVEYQRSSSLVSGVEPLETEATAIDSSHLSVVALEPIPLIREIYSTSETTNEPFSLEVGEPETVIQLLNPENQLASAAKTNETESVSELSLSVNETGELTVRTPTTIEEIRVTARRSLLSLRSQIRRAEKTLYSTYNEYNEIEEFRVHCRKKELYEDLRRSYRCWPQFFEDQVAAEAQSLLDGTGQSVRVVNGGPIENYFGVTAISTLKARNRSQFEGLKNNIMFIAMEQSEVYDSLSELAQLELAYQLRREECLAKPPVLFLLRRCS